jgi:CelD/BcsL family acetyltransferase involved in cellulose biosynthesis
VTQIDIIHGDQAFTTLADEWDELVQRSMTDTPFQRLAYQRSWWLNLHPPLGQLYTITLRDQDDRLQGLLSLYNNEGRLHFNGCVEETDYLDLICPAEFAPVAWEKMMNLLCGGALPAWESIDLCNIPADSPTRTILPELAAAMGLAFHTERHEVCPVITLPDSFEDYLAQIDSKQRREINRKLRRAKGAEVAIVYAEAGEGLTADVETFLNLLQKSTFEKRDWLNDGRRQVFHDTAAAAAQAGMLNLMFAEVNGEKAAALFNFEYDGRLWVYNSGLDPEAYGALSLGVVITAKAIEYAIENGLHTFDFLRGNETYKYRFGAEDTEIFRIHMEPRAA